MYFETNSGSDKAQIKNLEMQKMKEEDNLKPVN